MDNLIDIQKQNAEALIKRILDTANSESDTASLMRDTISTATPALMNRIGSFLKSWDTTAKNLKNQVRDIVPQEIDESKSVTENVVRNIPSVAWDVATDLVPVRPLEVGLTLAAGPAGKAVGMGGKLIGKGATKIAPALANKIRQVMTAPMFAKTATKEAGTIASNVAAPIEKILAPTVEQVTAKQASILEKLDPNRKGLMNFLFGLNDGATLRESIKQGLQQGLPDEQIYKNVNELINSGKIFDSAIAMGKITKEQAMKMNTLFSPTTKLEHTKELVNQALIEKPAAMLDTKKRVMNRVTEALQNNEINPQVLKDVLKQEKILPAEYAQHFLETMSTSGKQLAELSRLARVYGKHMPEEFTETLKNKINNETVWEKVKNVYNAIDNTRRQLMVTQLATAARNAVSQAGRYTLQTVEDGLTGAMRSLYKFEKPSKTMRPMFEDVAAFFRKVSPADRKRLNTILDSDLIEKSRLLSNIMGDLTPQQKILKVLNTPNILQENFYRKMAFDAKLNSLLAERGKNTATASMEEIKALMPKAVDHALEITYAAQPKEGTLAKGVLDMYRAMPFLTTLNAFPRFWANSQKFLVDYSPMGFARLFSPKFIQKMASKNSTEAFQSLAKAQLGTLMLTGAYALRNSPYAGEKWYEIKLPNGKYVDARPYAPFSTYMFMAEAMKDLSGKKTNITPYDWAQAVVSINRIAGTGLAIIDWIRANNPYVTEYGLKNILGQFIGNFTIPARTASDIIGGFGKPEKYVRDTTQNPVLGPAMANIPFLSRKLPPARSVLKETPVERENPIIRQLTGVTLKSKNPLEKEVDRLAVSTKDLNPKSGDAQIDLITKKVMGKQFSPVIQQLVQSKEYQQLDDIDKTEALKEAIGKGRRASLQLTKAAYPKKAVILRIKKMKPNMQKRAFDELLKQGKITKKDLEEMKVNMKALGMHQ